LGFGPKYDLIIIIELKAEERIIVDDIPDENRHLMEIEN